MRIETKNADGSITITNTVDPPEAVVSNDLRAKAAAALASNATFLGTVGARRTAIGSARTTATTKSGSLTIANVAAAQAELRLVYGMLVQVGAALDALNDQAELVTKENNAVIRLALGLLDS